MTKTSCVVFANLCRNSNDRLYYLKERARQPKVGLSTTGRIKKLRLRLALQYVLVLQTLWAKTDCSFLSATFIKYLEVLCGVMILRCSVSKHDEIFFF